MSDALLSATELRLRLGEKSVLDGVDIQVARGEFVSVIGPSGCGKSSLLLLLAGLRSPTSGRIQFDGEWVSGPSRRRAVIFQNHALFPWMSAVDNVRFATADDSATTALRYLELVGLKDAATLRPDQLSGGMQQRVGIARALAADPDLLLLDEPFASLDPVNRAVMSDELLRLARQLGKSMIFVTHNVDEALYLGDRVYVLSAAPARVVRQIEMPGTKPERIIDFRAGHEFHAVERLIHEHLFSVDL